TGWVTEDHCGAKGASTGHESCATRCVSEKGAKWALYVPEDKTLYIIVDQEEAAKHNSQEVKVMATMDKDKRTAKITAWTWQKDSVRKGIAEPRETAGLLPFRS